MLSMMRPFFSMVMILISVMTLGGCAATRPVGESASLEKELAGVKATQQALSGEVGRLRDNLLLVEARVQDQQKVIEELRRAQVAQKVTIPGEKAEIEASPAPSAPMVEAKRGQAPAPTEIYLQAFAEYASGRFQPAIEGFRTFLRIYPDSDYAGNAQYWLGECYYSMQQYARAVEEYRKVVDNYPQGSKAPEALLKMAAAQRQLNQEQKARETLQMLQNRYPGSAAAKKSIESN